MIEPPFVGLSTGGTPTARAIRETATARQPPLRRARRRALTSAVSRRAAARAPATRRVASRRPRSAAVLRAAILRVGRRSHSHLQPLKLFAQVLRCAE